MNVEGVTDRLHRLVLAWDYDNLWHRHEADKGVYDKLAHVPKTFDSIEVRVSWGTWHAGGMHAYPTFSQPVPSPTPVVLRAALQAHT